MDRQRKWEKEYNKGVKQYERKSKNEYDRYGKFSRINYIDLDTGEPKQRKGCFGCFIGCLKFIVISIFISIIILVILKVLL